MTFSSYQELRETLLKKETTCEAVTAAYLARAESKKDLNAYIALFQEKAISRARELDRKLASGAVPGKLFGMPIAIKDNIAIKDEFLTCGSKILSTFKSIYDATVIERLLSEDAIIIGKTNLDEFAMGSSNETSYYGPVKNPLDPKDVPGGSSGGSAVAVASDCALAALGSDTGGSVRQPASFCNLIGVKPTYGRVSRYGLVAFGSSFDQIGVFAKNATDAALVLQVIAGEDKHDSTSTDHPVSAYADEMKNVEVSSLKIGVPKEFFTDALNPEFKEIVTAKLEELKAKGAELIPVSLPRSEYALATYYILATAEASSNLARYDGARYGYRSPGHKDELVDMYTSSRSEGFGTEVKRRIMLGTYVLSAGYYDAYYKKAQQVRQLIRQDYAKAFEVVDVIAGPTSPFPAFRLGEKLDDPLAMYLADIYTVTANLAGVPAISVPIGLTKAGKAVGLQLIGKPFDEARLFGVSKEVEVI
ncbi:MAG: Asp-tRNA(Asn)/Glu-tRNA(Gln) amidotransferase subunit GatA [Chlorobiales bacterium]|nr:Asp-tRNA(Asn)/Glu-tRNA(Gln) amidotransferase subunit GatA [Chlorobiales bacterium]